MSNTVRGFCYNSHNRIEPGSYVQLLANNLKNGHLSVFEHAYATFYIDEISRTCSHQLVRQRLASFSQRSQRYYRKDSFGYTIPPEIKNNPEAIEIYQEAMMRIQEAYTLLVDLGIHKEDARFLMPNAAHTSLAMTANFREWLHIIDLRVSKHAQWEIRDLVTEIWELLYKKAPVIFGLSYFTHWSKDFDYKKEIFENKINKEV